MDYLAHIEYYWYWFGLALLLLLVEVAHGRFMFMAASLAAVAVGILSSLYSYVSIQVQILFFVVLAASIIWMARNFLEQRTAKITEQQNILVQRRYVGQVITLVDPIENGSACLNINGMVWTLRGEDCPTGSQVKVIDMGPGWLKVEPV